MFVHCVAKFRREFGWACRTGCGPRPELQAMPIMTTLHWRRPTTRDKMTDARDAVAARRPVRDTLRHQRPLLFRFSDVTRRENPAAAAAAADTNSPADVIMA